MSEIILVRVRDDYAWDMAQVDGRRFHKREPVRLAPHELTDNIRASELLVVERADAPDETPIAIAAVSAPATAEAHTEADAPAIPRSIKGKRGKP